MRFIAFITVTVLFSSCSIFKPAESRQATDAATGTTTTTTQRSSSPQFIGHITANGSSGNTTVKATPAANTVPNYAMTDNRTIEGSHALQFKYSLLLDAPVEQLTNLKLLEYIDEWYGTHYRFGGNSKDGIDCSAFSGGLMAAVFGIGLPRMAKDQYNAGLRVKKSELQEGDLVFFHTTRKGVSHVGVYVANNKFVHASLNYGVTISDLNDPYYLRTYVGARRARIADAPEGN
ncbi:MAG TPA: NlpC/P60 family protein [Chitinophagaceae bacterium]|jgi:lipoprotein Spr